LCEQLQVASMCSGLHTLLQANTGTWLVSPFGRSCGAVGPEVQAASAYLLANVDDSAEK
jgi:hypothetical protein